MAAQDGRLEEVTDMTRDTAQQRVQPTEQLHPNQRRTDRGSVFEFAGGEPAFLALAAAHHLRCLEDPVLNHPFSHPGNPDHIARLAAYWAEVFGGPSRYSQLYGGHSAMLETHARTGAGDDFGPRFVACFMQAADDADLPGDSDFREVLHMYMQWAVQEVLGYAPPEADVPAGLPVHKWSWNGLQ